LLPKTARLSPCGPRRTGWLPTDTFHQKASLKAPPFLPEPQAGIRVDGYWIFHVSQYQQNAWRFVCCFLVNGTQLTPLGAAILLSLSTGSDAFATRGSAIPYFSSPSFCAILTRSATDSACILCMMLARWNLMVLSVVANSPAICLLSSPVTRRASTSRSRGVSKS
jgi:hypothetical protein